MGNTRAMSLKEFDKELQQEYLKLNRSIARLRAELRDDPEGAMGGRGNNIAYNELDAMKARLAELMKLGYENAEQFGILVENDVDPSPITRIRFSDRRGSKVRITCDPGSRRGERGQDWIFDLGYEDRRGNWREGWRGEQPPAEILERANTITQALAGVDVTDFRDKYSTPRVYV